MFVHMNLVHMVEMTIVKVVHMAVMANRCVSAIRSPTSSYPRQESFHFWPRIGFMVA